MASIATIVEDMRNNPSGVRFADAKKVAEHYFGKARITGSHHIYKTPWPGDPRVNLQEDKGGKAKAYQVRQLLSAIGRLEIEHGKR